MCTKQQGWSIHWDVEPFPGLLLLFRFAKDIKDIWSRNTGALPSFTIQVSSPWFHLDFTGEISPYVCIFFNRKFSYVNGAGIKVLLQWCLACIIPGLQDWLEKAVEACSDLSVLEIFICFHYSDFLLLAHHRGYWLLETCILGISL